MRLRLFKFPISGVSKHFNSYFSATSQDGYNDSVFFFLSTVYFCLLASIGGMWLKESGREDNSILNYSV